MSLDYYFITRNGEPIAGTMPVPYEVAVTAAMLLNREYRRRDLFECTPADGLLVEFAPPTQTYGAVVTGLLSEIGGGVLSGPLSFPRASRDRHPVTC